MLFIRISLCFLFHGAAFQVGAHSRLGRPALNALEPIDEPDSIYLRVADFDVGTISQNRDDRVGYASVKSFLQSRFDKIATILHKWLKSLRIAAVVSTVVLQTMPSRSLFDMVSKSDVMCYDFYVFFTLFVGATQWFIYGLASVAFTGNTSFLTLALANAPGILLGGSWMFVFSRYVPLDDPRDYMLRWYLRCFARVLVLELLAICLYRRAAVFYLGLLGMCCGVNVAAAPFRTLQQVIRSRNTDIWSLDLIFACLVQSSIGCAFGLAVRDPWIVIPNVLCIISRLIQVAFVIAYMGGGPSGLTAMSCKPGAAQMLACDKLSDARVRKASA